MSATDHHLQDRRRLLVVARLLARGFVHDPLAIVPERFLDQRLGHAHERDVVLLEEPGEVGEVVQTAGEAVLAAGSSSSRTFRSMRARAAGRFPPVNVFLDDDAVLIDLEIPGKTAKDVDLSLEPQAVIIAGKRNEVGKVGGGGDESKPTVEVEDKSNNPTIKQSNNSPLWSRRLELPFRINTEKANAKFTNGILRIELPKAEAAGVKKITIQ